MASGAATTIASIRERNRRALTQAIVDEARRQLATTGAAGLSLRSVSRELGLASSAVYRYVASRDELLTLLIVDADNSLGLAVERAVARASGGESGRFRAFAMALRRWALAHPHEFALVYGLSVPGYRGSNEETRAPSRVTAVLAGLLRGAAAGTTVDDPEPPRALGAELARLLASPGFAGETGAPAAPARPVLMRGLMAWVELFGLINFELFGQFAHTIERTDLLYQHAVNVMIKDLF